jgi:NAD-dependent deacetylase
MHYVSGSTKIYYIDPKPSIRSQNNLTVIAENATIGVKKVTEKL